MNYSFYSMKLSRLQPKVDMLTLCAPHFEVLPYESYALVLLWFSPPSPSTISTNSFWRSSKLSSFFFLLLRKQCGAVSLQHLKIKKRKLLETVQLWATEQFKRTKFHELNVWMKMPSHYNNLNRSLMRFLFKNLRKWIAWVGTCTDWGSVRNHVVFRSESV